MPVPNLYCLQHKIYHHGIVDVTIPRSTIIKISFQPIGTNLIWLAGPRKKMAQYILIRIAQRVIILFFYTSPKFLKVAPPPPDRSFPLNWIHILVNLTGIFNFELTSILSLDLTCLYNTKLSDRRTNM